MKENAAKLGLTALFAGITAWLGDLAIPVYILVACNIIDYVTGIFAAKRRGERISSEIGFFGIAKKVCQWLLVLVGWMVDMLLAHMADKISPELKIPIFVALCTAFWLVANEMLSILENIDQIGVPIPGFLKKIIQYFLHTAEKKADDVIPEDQDMLNMNVEDAEE